MNATDVIFRHTTRVWEQELRRRPETTDPDRGYALTRTYRDLTTTGSTSLPESSGDYGSPAVRFVGPVGMTPFRFDLSCGLQLAGQLWPSPSAPVRAGRLHTTMTSIGRALADLHATPSARYVATSPHLSRLADHLRNPGPAVASALAQLGAGAVLAAQAMLDRLPEQGDTLHGGLSTASIFTDDDHGTVEIATGPEMHHGAKEVDLGWLIGELTEMEFSLSGTDADAAQIFGGAAAALVSGYRQRTGREVSAVRLREVVALRVLTHLCDYTSTSGRSSSSTHLTTFSRWLIEQAGSDHPTREEVRT